MERLTEKHYGGKGYYMKCSEKPGCNLKCGECGDYYRFVDRVAEFEDAQEEGRMWVAPCPMDTQMYRIVEGAAPHTRRRHKYIRVIYLSENNFFRVLRDFGKTVFLTLEEAQKALEGMKK